MASTGSGLWSSSGHVQEDPPTAAKIERQVKLVGFASLGIMLLLVLHCITHWAHNGKFAHIGPHVLILMLLPLPAWYAAARRSAKGAWSVHFLAGNFTFVHIFVLVMITSQLWSIDDWDPQNCRMARPCVLSHEAKTQKLAYSDDGQVWRCAGGPPSGSCIDASQRCDGVKNCFDNSDEMNCPDTSMPLLSRKAEHFETTELFRQEQCEMNKRKAEARKLRLKAWWICLTLPMMVLCVYAAYHGLELYVLLRMQRHAEENVAGGVSFSTKRLEDGEQEKLLEG